MENYYERIVENLGKLRRNEEQMTPEQKKQYAKPLQKLKDQIGSDATEVMRSFVSGGMRMKPGDDTDDWKDIVRATEKIIERHRKEGTIRRASRILFETYDVDKFLTALCLMHYEVWHLAYGPYWLKHITETGEEEYPYYNDILDMHWWAEHNEWAKTKVEDGKRVTDYEGGVTIMLPPTKELMEQSLEEERARLNEGR